MTMTIMMMMMMMMIRRFLHLDFRHWYQCHQRYGNL